MRDDANDRVGFHQARRARPVTRRKLAFAELITTAALALSIAIAAIAVSMEIARADALAPRASAANHSPATAD
jgi:hypothetical protein